MPDIPNPIPLVDGTAASSVAVDRVLYEPLATTTNFELINGRLDSLNVTSASRISSSEVQGGAFTSAEQGGATGRNDYYYNFFVDVEFQSLGGAVAPYLADVDNTLGAPPDDYNLEPDDFILIPGAGKSFYLPRTCNVLMFWHVETEALNQSPNANSFPTPQTNDTPSANDALILQLFVDGAKVVGAKRQLKCTMIHPWVEDGGNPVPFFNQQELRYFRRKWSGHYVVQLAAGWHNAGIGIVHQVYHVRTVTKRFGYVAMRA